MTTPPDAASGPTDHPPHTDPGGGGHVTGLILLRLALREAAALVNKLADVSTFTQVWHTARHNLLGPLVDAHRHHLDGVVAEVDQLGVLVVVHQHTAPDSADLDLMRVDGGEHVLEH